ncbi:hypothetical protein GC722_11190 [Auraticoccus sp. F435]|uniref:Uncharacterized protein n=1 Tax=Auraticoccus cholistanensis TaxID=2656650 RepID=A0A6A9UY28_9ACTN|nr:hypothetical protein [Auraticoccus cholistanensis]
MPDHVVHLTGDPVALVEPGALGQLRLRRVQLLDDHALAAGEDAGAGGEGDPGRPRHPPRLRAEQHQLGGEDRRQRGSGGDRQPR